MQINIFTLLKVLLPQLFIAGCFAIGLELLKRKINEKFGESSSERIERLSNSLKEAASLSSEIEDEITRRNKIVEKLQKDLERYEELKKMKEPEVEAIVQTMRGELRREGKKSLWQSAGINLVFFLAGIAVTMFIS